jgi:hypothetical protein
MKKPDLNSVIEPSLWLNCKPAGSGLMKSWEDSNGNGCAKGKAPNSQEIHLLRQDGDAELVAGMVENNQIGSKAPPIMRA